MNWVGIMRSKKELNRELVEIKKKLHDIQDIKTSEKQFISEKDVAATNSANLMKYIIDENRKTTMILKGIMDKMARIEQGLHEIYYDEDPEPEETTNVRGVKEEVPVSALDAQIIQAVQRRGMACADDIKKEMNYKGRNAASTHLNKLYREGILDRYQLGKRVYYKLNAGKATTTQFITPAEALR